MVNINNLFGRLQRIFFEEISPKFQVDSLKNLMDYIYVIVEKLIVPFDIFHQLYLEFYDDLVEKEVKIASIKYTDRVLVIGCGSLPATSILIASKTNSTVVSIDTDYNAIEKAKRIIKNHGLEDKITCVHGDGISYPLEDYDVIFLLYGIKQQKEILKYVSNNMKEEARVIYRTTDDVLENVVGGERWLSKFFIVKTFVQSRSIAENKSYLLLKLI
ncbi:MAG: hypothetical protein DRN12_03080 [Thermoplasmata archaeon]|nr:MAG: hypothetical protein DRN12_03080 [Thermoplasmata archaeon]HEC89802.1 class I SAM-dependent methyltransferase [Thermoplasmatales archaeon]